MTNGRKTGKISLRSPHKIACGNVNWVVEILVRWSAFLKTKSILTLIFAILVTFFGLAIGWVDVVWCLLFKHMIFAKA